ncbi:MAG: hypothetical protein ACFFAZ_11200 [Promethearchaeota archaeon]|jgi:hypothetical protein
MQEDVEELTVGQTIGLILVVIVAAVLTLYTFIIFSESLLGWTILILMGAFGLVLVILLNRKYGVIASLR